MSRRDDNADFGANRKPSELSVSVAQGDKANANSVVKLPGEIRSKAKLSDRLALPAQRIPILGSSDQSSEVGNDAVRGSGGLWRDIMTELLFLEATTAYWALQAANPTDVDLQQFQYRIDQSADLRVSGEIAIEELMQCLHCAHQYYARGTITITPCEQCGCQYFSIASAH